MRRVAAFDSQLRRHSRARRTTTRASRAATSRAERTRSRSSNPREAALQGLAKMRALAAARLRAGGAAAARAARIVPALRALGFAGSDADVLARAARDAPRLLAACSSAAAMWVANAATVSPSADTADGRVHFTPANLVVALPPLARSADDDARAARDLRRRRALRRPRPAARRAAVRRRRRGQPHALRRRRRPRRRVLRLRQRAASATAPAPTRFPARQTREASRGDRAPARPAPARVVFAQQNPDAIDAGVFHNDVIAVGAGSVAAVPRARVRRPARACSTALARAIGPAFTPIVVARARAAARRRGRHVPVQQPADRARRRALAARRAGRVPRACRARALPRPPGRDGRRRSPK